MQIELNKAFFNIAFCYKFKGNAYVHLFNDIKFTAPLVFGRTRDFFNCMPHALKFNVANFGMRTYGNGYFYGHIFANVYGTAFVNKFFVLSALVFLCFL